LNTFSKENFAKSTYSKQNKLSALDLHIQPISSFVLGTFLFWFFAFKCNTLLKIILIAPNPFF